MTLLLVAAAGATLAITLWATRGSDTEPADGNTPGADPKANQPAPAPQQGAPPTTTPAADSRQLLLPDGTEVAPLNGVANPPKVLWGDRPYSPIVKVTHTTIDWYLHADGSLTTTLEVWRKDLGRKDAVTMVCNPTDVAPLEIDGKIIPLPERPGLGR
ncbi:MAG: hypothetical protein IPK26_03575 [Planctomycetes bacterium]|nr:hypothetical protein [Planctomycetota bacterium]